MGSAVHQKLAGYTGNEPSKSMTSHILSSGICQYMAEQRCDIAFRTKEIVRDAAGPTTASKTKLKRITRCLKGRQRCVLNFPWVTKLDDVIHVTVDPDWAGERRQGAPRLEEYWQLARASLNLIGQ